MKFSICRPHDALEVIGVPQVQFRKDLSIADGLKGGINEGKWIFILKGYVI